MSIYEVKTLYNKRLNHIFTCNDGKNNKYMTLSSIVDIYEKYGLITGEEHVFIYRNISYSIKFNKTICGFVYINIDRSECNLYEAHGGIKYHTEKCIGFSTNTQDDIKLYNICDINHCSKGKTVKLPGFIHNECKIIIDQYLEYKEIFNIIY